MGAVFAAILDTCVLWPSLQRDFLLSMAVENIYRPLWSEAILQELERHEELKLMDRGSEPAEASAKAGRLIEMMRRAFDDAIVTGWEPLDGSYGLPDPDDEHLVAAAVIGGAGAIVTENFKDLPRDKVPGHIKILGCVKFATESADVNPEAAARAIVEMSKRHVLGEHTPHEILELLVTRYGMNEVAEIVEPALDELGN